ncbi:hypothetical protein [Pseudanabaena biceps]|nr:hypothetical protein [Pseudanabaena biceps]
MDFGGSDRTVMILQKVVSKLTDRHDESCYRGMRRKAPHPSVRFFRF